MKDNQGTREAPTITLRNCPPLKVPILWLSPLKGGSTFIYPVRVYTRPLKAVQKTLVFWTVLEPLKVIPSLYLDYRPETRYNNQSPGKDRFHEFLYSG